MWRAVFDLGMPLASSEAAQLACAPADLILEPRTTMLGASQRPSPVKLVEIMIDYGML